jgi:hypothetical protein
VRSFFDLLFGSQAAQCSGRGKEARTEPKADPGALRGSTAPLVSLRFSRLRGRSVPASLGGRSLTGGGRSSSDENPGGELRSYR